MCQTEGPETQIGSRVGDTAQAKLNGVDSLVDDQLSPVYFLKQQHHIHNKICHDWSFHQNCHINLLQE